MLIVCKIVIRAVLLYRSETWAVVTQQLKNDRDRRNGIIVAIGRFYITQCLIQ
jgi:hypothetical protein